MKTLETGSGQWWAIKDSNLRPLPCQGLEITQIIDIYRPDLLDFVQKWTRLHKTAQKLIRKLRYSTSARFKWSMSLSMWLYTLLNIDPSV